jgi:cysteine synthase A
LRILPGTGFLIGDTPMVRLDRLAARHGCFAEIFLKLEYFNPAFSSKDRVAKVMLEEAEKSGKIKPNFEPAYTLVEATNGNLGISLAFMAAQKGYKLVLAAPEDIDEARKNQLRVMGAELTLTPKSEGMRGALQEAEEIVKKTPYSFLTGQFTTNICNLAHYKTTGPELWHQCGGQVDVFVAMIGSGGTVSGVGRYLKERSKTVKIVGLEPLGNFNIEPKALNRSYLDETMKVTRREAIETAQELMRLDGIFGGLSTGANIAAAIKIARSSGLRSRRIVCMACGRAENYLCPPLLKN